MLRAGNDSYPYAVLGTHGKALAIAAGVFLYAFFQRASGLPFCIKTEQLAADVE